MELKLGLFRFAPGFLLLLIAFAVYSDIAVPFIVSALIHEVGHLVVLLRIKARITKIEFNLGGISICYDGYRLSYNALLSRRNSGLNRILLQPSRSRMEAVNPTGIVDLITI